jgi:hypothetical protein
MDYVVSSYCNSHHHHHYCVFHYFVLHSVYFRGMSLHSSSNMKFFFLRFPNFLQVYMEHYFQIAHNQFLSHPSRLVRHNHPVILCHMLHVVCKIKLIFIDMCCTIVTVTACVHSTWPIQQR